MKTTRQLLVAGSGCLVWALTLPSLGQDWPQWRGPHRDGRAAEFKAPASWPAELTRKWQVQVGEGTDSSPALVGDRLYVFARQEGAEVLRCLDAATGKEIWMDKYDALPATGPAASHAGPRSSVAVSDGKVVTVGVRGVVSCLNAADGKLLWRKDEFPGVFPRFFAAASPLLVDGKCIALTGGSGSGGLVAFDLGTGDVRWKWTGEGPDYGSPVLLEAGGARQVVTLTEQSLVGIGLSDGSLLWQIPFAPQRRAYNAATPIVDGPTVIYTGSGRGTHALRVEKSGDALTSRELWSNADIGVQFNTPVLKDGLLFGLSDGGDFFCLKAGTGETAWTHATGERGGFGSVVDAGSVLLAMTPKSELIVLKPDAADYKELARYKVSESPTYACPVASGNRVIIQDQAAVTLWTVN